MPTIRGDADAFIRGLGLDLEAGDELTERQAAIYDLVQAALDLMDAREAPTPASKREFRDAADNFVTQACHVWNARWGIK